MGDRSGLASPDTFVLIHGLWVTPRSWEHWKKRYEDRGYLVLAPAWPGMDAAVQELNRDPSPIAELDAGQVIEHYDQVIRSLSQPPIIVGHSVGGAFTQILLGRGLGAAGVSIACDPAQGVRHVYQPAVTAIALRGPFHRGRAVPLTAGEFHDAFASTLGREESDRIYRLYHVPAPAAVLQEAVLASQVHDGPAIADFHAAVRAPLLFIGFGDDHPIPRRGGRRSGENHDYPGLITEFREFPGRPHFPGAPGWEQVADYVLRWAVEHAVMPGSRGNHD